MKTVLRGWSGLVVVAARLVLATGLASCATSTWPSPGAAAQCGNPCATLACPSAFSCYVDGRCVARCQPEPVKPGFP